MVKVFHWIAAVTLMISSICSARAVESRPKTSSKTLADSGKGSTPKIPIPADHQIEAKANDLVLRHLPELKDVLKRLRADRSREYDRAIRDLAKSAKRLEAAKNRDPKLYEIELELLKAQHEVNLLTAKLKVRDSRDDRGHLRVSAARLQDAQIARAQYDVDVLRQRHERAKKLLETASERLEAKRSEPEAQLEESYLGFLRRAGRDAAK